MFWSSPKDTSVPWLYGSGLKGMLLTEYEVVDWVGVIVAVSVVELPHAIDWSGPALIMFCPSAFIVIRVNRKETVAKITRG